MSVQLAYPASHLYSQLTQSQLALKIARHSSCMSCGICPGLHPPPGVEVIFDDVLNQPSLGDLGQYGSDDDDAFPMYLETCSCGHSVQEHGADWTVLGPAEFARRGRMAIRLDELLQDTGKLLDFDYTDEDIISLRQDLGPPVSMRSSSANHSSPDHRSQSVSSSSTSSELSDGPPAKKRRVSISLSSEAEEEENSVDEDDEEEDRPLAARMAVKAPALRIDRTGVYPSRGGKKKGPGMTKKRAPASFGSSGQGDHSSKIGSSINGHEPRIKLEDDAQLGRLAATGMTDSGKSQIVPTEKVEKASWVELRQGIIQVTPIENDGQPRSMVVLTGLKTLFQRQLPNMPREYITRIVYETNSRCLAIIKRGYKVVGGICYRPFHHRGFAEIVFFATTSVDQYKGYGAMLMDHFKNHIRSTYPDMMHFLTYADDFAVGYFEKQGFSKDITLDRSIWAGYIKDYEGATIMQCKLLRKVDYLNKTEILAKQQEAVLTKIKQISRSHVVYPGLPQFQPGPNQASSVNLRDVPGLRNSSWDPSMTSKSKSSDHQFMERVLKDLTGRSQAWPFMKPVNDQEVPDYYDVIKNPMDFETMSRKVETNQYPTSEAFISDAMLIFDNCRKYNPEHSIYARHAVKLQSVLETLISQRMKRER